MHNMLIIYVNSYMHYYCILAMIYSIYSIANIWYYIVRSYHMAQISDKGNIDKFLVIHQNFPYQIFPLAITNVALATDHQYFIHWICLNSSIFSLVKNLCHLGIISWVVCPIKVITIITTTTGKTERFIYKSERANVQQSI